MKEFTEMKDKQLQRKSLWKESPAKIYAIYSDVNTSTNE